MAAYGFGSLDFCFTRLLDLQSSSRPESSYGDAICLQEKLQWLPPGDHSSSSHRPGECIAGSACR